MAHFKAKFYLLLCLGQKVFCRTEKAVVPFSRGCQEFSQFGTSENR